MTPGDPMRKDQLKAVAFRLTPDLIKRLDAHAERMQQIHKGLTLSRAVALRSLLEEALEKYEASEPKKRR